MLAWDAEQSSRGSDKVAVDRKSSAFVWVRMSGISPPTDPSSSDGRSRSSPEDSNQNPNATRVPAVTTVLVPRRIQLPSSRDAMRVDESSDTSMEASRQNRYRQRAPRGPNPSNSPDEDNPVDLSATQAAFLAGAAVTQAHHAANLADHASNVANPNYKPFKPDMSPHSSNPTLVRSLQKCATPQHEPSCTTRRKLTPLWLRGTGVRSCLSITSLNKPNN